MSKPHALTAFVLCIAAPLWIVEASPKSTTANVARDIKAVRNTGKNVRPDTISASKKIGAKAREAILDLVKSLDAEDMRVRWNAAVALGKIGTEALPGLIHALDDEHENVRLGATVAIGTFGPGGKAAVPALINALKDRNASVREHAAEALGKIGPEARPATDALILSFSDQDPFVNGKAAEALSAIGTEAVPALIETLKDQRAIVRWCAAVALGAMGPEASDAVPALVDALKDTSDNLRWCSAVAIGNVGKKAKAAVPALIGALVDKDQDVRWGASRALDIIDPGAIRRFTGWPSTKSVIDSLLPDLMKELHVPGVSIALINDRAVVMSKSYGVMNVNQPDQVTEETLFEACSMTKPVFAYTVMKLVEQRKLLLDRPLVNYLDEPCLRDQPYHDRITARMVLSHTSGLPNWRKGEEERNGPLPVQFEPGSKFGYSGEGMLYLQHVVEHITGEPLELYAQRTLFEPLGLTHTSYVWTMQLDPYLASGHDTSGAFLKKTKYTTANAAYTLYTTAREYAMFLIEIMKTNRSAKHSLSKQSIDAMLKRRVRADAREPIERPGRARGSAVYWGLGWSINATKEGDIMHHSGSNRTGFRCFSQFNPRKGSGMVIMTNSSSGGDLWTRLVNLIGDQ